MSEIFRTAYVYVRNAEVDCARIVEELYYKE